MLASCEQSQVPPSALRPPHPAAGRRRPRWGLAEIRTHARCWDARSGGAPPVAGLPGPAARGRRPRGPKPPAGPPLRSLRRRRGAGGLHCATPHGAAPRQAWPVQSTCPAGRSGGFAPSVALPPVRLSLPGGVPPDPLARSAEPPLTGVSAGRPSRPVDAATSRSRTVGAACDPSDPPPSAARSPAIAPPTHPRSRRASPPNPPGGGAPNRRPSGAPVAPPGLPPPLRGGRPPRALHALARSNGGDPRFMRGLPTVAPDV